MDACILKDLYENLDSLDKFVILVGNNYDPDKKLLYELLELIDKDGLIEYESLYLIYNLMDKLLKQKNYKDDIKYFNLAFKIKIYEIIKLLITYKIKINNDELECLNNVKNPIKIVSLMIENGYREQLKEYFILKIKNKYSLHINSELLKILLIKFRECITPDMLNIIISDKKDINLIKFIQTELKIYNFVTIGEYLKRCSHDEIKDILPGCEIFNYIVTNNMLNVEKDFGRISYDGYFTTLRWDYFIRYCHNHILKILSLYKDKMSDFLFYLLVDGFYDKVSYDVINFIFKDFKITNLQLAKFKNNNEYLYKQLLLRLQYCDIEKIKLYYDIGFFDKSDLDNYRSDFKTKYNEIIKYINGKN